MADAPAGDLGNGDARRCNVNLICRSEAAADAVAAHARTHGAPAFSAARVAFLPGDQPGWLFGLLEWAVEHGHTGDDNAARTIGLMSDSLDRQG